MELTLTADGPVQPIPILSPYYKKNTTHRSQKNIQVLQHYNTTNSGQQEEHHINGYNPHKYNLFT
eukprot:21816-Amphidinium_carterae.1